ncbi:MAG: hypothetical protein O9320_19715 [Magnetospirillum sp.]|jgi:hypothetical protein|nr:hypothetical protein [Magnetospirillum sp.]
MANKIGDLVSLVRRIGDPTNAQDDKWEQDARKLGASDEFIEACRQVRRCAESGMSNETVTAAVDRATNILLYFL